MTLYVGIAVNYNLAINYNQPSAASGMATSSPRFLANVGSLACRCLPFLILSVFGITPPGGNKK